LPAQCAAPCICSCEASQAEAGRLGDRIDALHVAFQIRAQDRMNRRLEVLTILSANQTTAQKTNSRLRVSKGTPDRQADNIACSCAGVRA